MLGVWQREARKRTEVELAIARVTMISDSKVIEPLNNFDEIARRFSRELLQAHHTYDIRCGRSDEDERLYEAETEHFGNANVAIGELENLAKGIPGLARTELAAELGDVVEEHVQGALP